MREDALAVVKWKQAPYAKGRRASSKVRPISAENLKNAIMGQYGFLLNVLPGLAGSTIKADPASIRTLPELFTPDLVSAFIDWAINTRKLKGQSMVARLATICAALKEYPSYAENDFSWYDELIRSIPLEPESQRRERKEQKYIAYEAAADIPRRIQETRQEAATRGVRPLAFTVHDELLMKWLVILPWRQRNIRECRVGLKSEGANLFKAEIEQWDAVRKPRWLEERLKVNPHEQVWQYHFRESETKNGHEVRSILPQRLVPLLEEYLNHHQAHIVTTDDQGTLFLNRRGHPLDSGHLNALISKLTLRHAGRRVSPHRFRDIWAYWWLSSHPEDYLTVSKKLWHRNLEVTIRVYGCKFDESHADCRVENFIDEQG